MITLIDSSGQEVDSSPYRERLIVSADRQEEIRQGVAKAEEKIHESSGETKEIKEFLERFTYTQNLLDDHYQPSVESLTQITPFATPSLLSDDLAESVNKQMYHLEKVARVGIPVNLSTADKKVISRAEDYFYGAGGDKPLRLIKMLGRHAKLGLPEIDPERKEYLQEILRKQNLLFRDWLGCSALRAGFALAPCPTTAVEYQIRGYIDQEPRIMEEILIFGNRIFDGALRKKIMQDREKQLNAYVNGVHHLKRLLEEG